MQNNTKKAIMLGVLLLGCGITSLIGSLLGNKNKINTLDKEQLVHQRALENKSITGAEGNRQKNMLKIYVSGAVLQPGLYDLPYGSRADDAVKAAGGFLNRADTQKVNLALKLKDGMQVNVPFVKGSSSWSTNRQLASKSGSGENSRTGANSVIYEQKRDNRTVNINIASQKELEALPGIGASMAKKIIEYRQKKRFDSIEDLLKIPGIGTAKLNRLKGRIVV